MDPLKRIGEVVSISEEISNIREQLERNNKRLIGVGIQTNIIEEATEALSILEALLERMVNTEFLNVIKSLKPPKKPNHNNN